MFPQELTNKMKEEHRQTIEEKEPAVVLLNNELQVIQYSNVELQGKIRVKYKTIKDLIDN